MRECVRVNIFLFGFEGWCTFGREGCREGSMVGFCFGCEVRMSLRARYGFDTLSMDGGGEWWCGMNLGFWGETSFVHVCLRVGGLGRWSSVWRWGGEFTKYSSVYFFHDVVKK